MNAPSVWARLFWISTSLGSRLKGYIFSIQILGSTKLYVNRNPCERDDHIMELVAEQQILRTLVDGYVKHLQEVLLITHIQEVLLIHSEYYGYFGAQPPEIFVIDESQAVGVVLSP